MSTANFDITATIEQARTGDTGAFAQIVRQYQSLVSGVLFSATGDFHKSEDFTQETFLIAWQKLGELRETDHLAAWLCTIARNLVHRSHRKPTIVTEPLTEGTGRLTPTALAPDAELLRQEQSDFVWSAIGEIDEKYRETLVLYYRGGQSVREIASATESTEEVVRQRLVRARKSLKAKLEEMVGTILTDTAPGEAFTLTVMTALGAAMLTATTAQAAVATGTGTVATGSQAGWFGWWALFLWVFAPIIFITGGFMGLWTALKHSPTLRTRRFMCRAALQWFVFLIVLMMFVDPHRRQWDVHYGALFYGYFVVLIVFCSWLVYRWRMLLEEDAGLRALSDKPLEKTSLSLFWLRCWYWLSMLPTFVVSVFIALDLYLEFRGGYEPDNYTLWNDVFAAVGCSIWMSIPIGFYLVIGYGIRTSRNENALLHWYPHNEKSCLPKQDEKTHWQSLWFDLIVMYFVTVMPMIPMFVSYEILNSGLAWILFPTMMMTVATLIASHSAGIPSKRLWGYAQLFFFVGLCYAVIFSLGSGYAHGNVSINGIAWRVVFVFVYFIAAGLLYAFRKKTSL